MRAEYEGLKKRSKLVAAVSSSLSWTDYARPRVRAIGAHHLASVHLFGAVIGVRGGKVTSLGFAATSLCSKSDEMCVRGTCQTTVSADRT